MTPEEEHFAIMLSDTCKSHKEWLSVVRFGLKTLLENQALLIEIIWREAGRMVERTAKGGDANGRVPSDEARLIFEELGLKFSMA